MNHFGADLDAGLRQVPLRLDDKVQPRENGALVEPLVAQQRRPAGAQRPDRPLAPGVLAGNLVLGLQRDAQPRVLAALLDHGGSLEDRGGAAY